MARPNKIRRKHCAKFPWKEWFSRHTFTLKKGQHFQYRTDTMATTVRTNAKRWGVRVSIHITEDAKSLVVSVVGRRDDFFTDGRE